MTAKIDLEELRDYVGSLVDSEESHIKRSTGWRCHEVARWLAPQIGERFHCHTKVQDGVARYLGDILVGPPAADQYPANSPEAKLIAMIDRRGEQMRPITFSITHSWCVVDGEIIVDFHNQIGMNDSEGYYEVGDILFVHQTNRLPPDIQYRPIGFSFRMFGYTVVVPRIPYFTLLRM